MSMTSTTSVRLHSQCWSGSLLGGLDQLRQTSAMCDLAIITSNGHVLLAHACVLVSASSYIHSFLAGKRPKFPAVRLAISDDIWNIVLRFIYTGETRHSPDQMSGLHSAASLLGIDALTQATESASRLMGTKITAVTTPVERQVESEDALADLSSTEAVQICEPTLLAQSGVMQSLESTSVIEENTPELNLSPDRCQSTNTPELNLSPDGCQSTNTKAISHDDDRIIESETGDEEGIAPAAPAVERAEAKSEVMNRRVADLQPESEHSYAQDVRGGKERVPYAHRRRCSQCKKYRGKTGMLVDGCKCELFKCDQCAREFVQECSFVEHKKQIHNEQQTYQCRSCDKVFNGKNTLKAHERGVHSGRSFMCSVCGMQFKMKLNLKKHEYLHSGLKPHKCPTCGHNSATKSGLISHQRTHTGIKQLCTSCGKLFSVREALLRHIRNKHTHPEVLPFQCASCGKKFRWRYALRTHVTDCHSGEKPYQCSSCDKVFSKKVNLVIHARIHTGEKPYQCSSCDKVFSKKISFLNHTRIHTVEKPFECSSCDKVFSKKVNLVNHTRIHTGEKPYQCSSCDKVFSQQISLLNHARIHTGEKPYRCSSCDKAFRNMGNLVKHIACIHR